MAYTVRCACKGSHILLLHGYMELESPMVDAKFQDQGTSGSEGNDIFFLLCIGMAAILVMKPRPNL